MATTLLDAIKSKDLEAARAAMATDPSAARGVSPEGASLVCLAVYYGQIDIAEAVAAAKDTLDVFDAAALGRVDRLTALLDADPSLANARAGDGFPALGLAAYFKHPAAARLLLDRGADPNLAASNAAKVTALHAAISSNQLEIAEWLLDAGADVNARQQMDYTPLMGAAANARESLIDLLLARGADRTLTTTDGKTAADLAREHGHEATAARLE
jgi:ankyrin repeat protein